ncbi:MAG: aminopeptidase [Duncaniella sp.]|nr:aminopeptidase [Duncaniella sp.]
MKKLISTACIALAALSATAAKKAPADSTGFQFKDIKVVPCTPVKDQNKSGTCWSFAGTGLMEHEVLRRTGKTVDLSEMWVVRHCYDDKADKYVRMDGTINFAQGGSTLDVPYVIDLYGIVPEEAYPGLEYGETKHDHYELEPVLSGIVNAVNDRKGKKSTAWKQAFASTLDAYFGQRPATFVVDGVTYTPQEYAKALGLSGDDFIAVTSYTHHPFYTQFPVEVADNWLWAPYWNVPMEEMKAIVDNALENGYSVAWAADVSEPGFKWKDGFAVLPKEKSEKDMEGTELARWVKLSDKERKAEQEKITGPREELTVTQQMRQDMFDSHETTDDHGMIIVGKAVDQNGTPYYKVKNSWDTNQIYDGYLYVSEPFFLAKTIDIYVNKEAVPAEIAAKLK